MKVINFCIRYKYVLTVVVFLFYLFFGDNNIFENRRWNEKIKSQEEELTRCKITIASIKNQNNPSSMATKDGEEDYFRNHLYFKKNNEDVFQIVYGNEK